MRTTFTPISYFQCHDGIWNNSRPQEQDCRLNMEMAGLAQGKPENTEDLADHWTSQVPQGPPLVFKTSVPPNRKNPSDVPHSLLLEVHFLALTALVKNKNPFQNAFHKIQWHFKHHSHDKGH